MDQSSHSDVTHLNILIHINDKLPITSPNLLELFYPQHIHISDFK